VNSEGYVNLITQGRL